MDLLAELDHRILLADGDLHASFHRAGIGPDQCLAELCISQPDLVRDLHGEFIAAGARVVRANSLGANSLGLTAHEHEHRVAEFNRSAAQLASDAGRAADPVASARNRSMKSLSALSCARPWRSRRAGH